MSGSVQQYTYWSMTLNNPDENDFVLVRNPNAKYIRELVWTLEKGSKEETPHIQAWIRLQRNQTLTFIKKLFPKGHFKFCAKDEYNENTHTYAQKNDDTTAGQHVITLNDPLPNTDTLLYQVLQRIIDEYPYDYDDDICSTPRGKINFMKVKKVMDMSEAIECDMVETKSNLEKVFISPAYEKMKKRFWKNIMLRLMYKQDGSNSVQEISGRSRSSSDCSETSWMEKETISTEVSSSGSRFSG